MPVRRKRRSPANFDFFPDRDGTLLPFVEAVTADGGRIVGVSDHPPPLPVHRLCYGQLMSTRPASGRVGVPSGRVFPAPVDEERFEVRSVSAHPLPRREEVRNGRMVHLLARTGLQSNIFHDVATFRLLERGRGVVAGFVDVPVSSSHLLVPPSTDRFDWEVLTFLHHEGLEVGLEMAGRGRVVRLAKGRQQVVKTVTSVGHRVSTIITRDEETVHTVTVTERPETGKTAPFITLGWEPRPDRSPEQLRVEWSTQGRWLACPGV